jgi:hypothetical protein
MAQEIEKKFLVKGDFKADVFKATRITHGRTSAACRSAPCASA